MPDPAAIRSQEAFCAHCGLQSGGAEYCCYGCELAHQLAAESEQDRHTTAGVLTVSLLLGMLVMMLSLFLYAEDIYEATADPMFAWLRGAYRVASAVLATPVVLMLGIPLAKRSLRTVLGGKITMELLILVGAVAAWTISIVNIVSGDATGSSAVYFDSAVAALVLTTFGRYLEAKARAHASQLVGHLVEPSTKPIRAGAPLAPRAPATIEPGMPIAVSPEEVVPVDARVTAPVEVSLAVLTGESTPVKLMVGDEVPAGAVPVSHELTAVALRPARESALEQLAALAQDLRSSRAPIQRLADTLAAWLTPVVTLTALGALAYWGPALGWARGVEIALAVVLVACPCTYGVITPLISWLALRKALQQGVCIRHAAIVESMAQVQRVAFDKTGTLTVPLSAVRMHRLSSSETDLRPLVGALERDLRHPIAKALASWAEGHEEKLEERELCDSRGVRALTPSGEALLGAADLLCAEGIDVPESEVARSALLALGGELVASFEVDERLRPEAREALETLTEAGHETLILTGDRQERAARWGAELGVEARGGLRAEDKVAALEAHGGRQMIVGDGVNDAPATAAAVGVAVVGAAGLNRGLADVTLLRDDLRLVPWSLGLAKRSVQLSRRTLAAATAYNLAFVAMAAAGTLRPVWAGLSMLAASLLALASALRMVSYPAFGSEGESPDDGVSVAAGAMEAGA